MKVRIGVLIGLAVLLLTGPAFAQDRMTAGIKGGLNLAKVSEEGEKFEWLTGGMIGGFLRMPLRGALSLQPEVLYSMQGTKTEDGSTIKLNYVLIPVLLHARMGGANAHPFVNVGPVFGMRTKAQAEIDGQTLDFKDQVKKRDMAVLLGGGVEVSNLILEARYSLGLVNIAEEDADKVRSHVVTFLAGLRF